MTDKMFDIERLRMENWALRKLVEELFYNEPESLGDDGRPIIEKWREDVGQVLSLVIPYYPNRDRSDQHANRS